MNNTRTLIASALLALAAAPAFAVDFDGNPDNEQSILNDHGNRGYVGTSFSAPSKIERGTGDLYGSILLDVGARPSSAGAEKGQGDWYGSVLNDLGH